MKLFGAFLVALFLTAGTDLAAKSEIELKEGSVKIRSRGICYIDPGISKDQAKLLSKFDAMNETLNDIGVFFEKNDSLLIYQVKRSQMAMFLSNRLDILVYREGEESIDGYPSYVSDISTEINLKALNDILFRAKTDNKFRYVLQKDLERFRTAIKDINFLKLTTSKIPDNFISDLYVKLNATEWANKANLSAEEGIKIEYYSIAVDMDRLYETSYIQLSESMLKAGQNSLVMGMLNRLINLDPLNFPAAYAVRGQIYYVDRQYAAAIKELEKSIAIYPDFVFSYCILGSVLADLKKTDEAFEKYSQAVRTDPDYYLPYLYRANLYRKNGKYDEALLDYSISSEKNPRNIEPYYNSGLIYFLTGLYEKAVEEYSKAIYIDELASPLYFNRAISLRKMNENERAGEDYKTYLLLTVKDIDDSKIPEMIDTWMRSGDLNPIIID